MTDLRLITACAVVLAAGASAGCEEDSAAKSSSDRAVVAWKAAGIEVPTFEAMAGAGIGGGACKSGIVQGLETVVCTFASADAAKSARGAGLTYIGETTGVALPAGDALLVVVDRENSDPTGKAINTIAKTFLAAMADKPAGADKDKDKDKAGADKDKDKAGAEAEAKDKAGDKAEAKDKAGGDKAGN